MTIIERVFNEIKVVLGGLRVADGYYFDWSEDSILDDAEDWVLGPKSSSKKNDKDFAEAFPIIELAWDAEDPAYNSSSAQSYTTFFRLRLHCYAYADVTDYIVENAKIRSDVLRAFGNNSTINNSCEEVIFTGSDIAYTQNRKRKPFAQMDLTFDIIFNFDQLDPDRRC